MDFLADLAITLGFLACFIGVILVLVAVHDRVPTGFLAGLRRRLGEWFW